MNIPESPRIGSGRKPESAYTLRLKARKVECQVEGCDERLPKNTAYHKRYRICVHHSSLPQMIIDGRHVRFCQQCGRFQPLSDFDADRKSCRKKLKTHNRRRKQARTAGHPNREAAGQAESGEGTSSQPSASGSEEVNEIKFSPGGSGSSRRGAVLAVSAGKDDGDFSFSGSEPLLIDDILDIDTLLYQLDSEADAELASTALLPVHNPISPLLPPSAPPPLLLPGDINNRTPGVDHRSSVFPLPTNAPYQVQNAANMLNSNTPASSVIEFSAPSDLTRVSLKLFNVHPEELPEGISEQLHRMMSSSAFLQINARTGCTHITVDALLSPSETSLFLSRGSKAFLDTAVAQGPLLFPEKTFEGSNGKVIAQIGNEASVFGENLDFTVNFTTPDSKNATPILKNLVPFATIPGERCAFGLYGSNINASRQDMVVCRRGSALANVEVIRSGSTNISSECDYVEFVLPRPAEGLHFVEVQRGSLLSPTGLPFLVIDSVDAVKELRQLEYDTSGFKSDAQNIASFLRSVGVVLDWLKKKEGILYSSSNTAESINSIPGYKAYIPDVLQTTSETAKVIASLAQRVAATCIVRGWPALLRLVLPAMMPSGIDPATVIEEFKSFSDANLPLLHLAVLSRCAEVVQVLADWASQIGYTWQCEAHVGPADNTTVADGINPLHLAALLDDGGRMAASLTSLFLDQFDLWSYSGGGGGGEEGSTSSTTTALASVLSPADFAFLVDNQAICSWLKKNGVSLNDNMKSLPLDENAGGAGGSGKLEATLQNLNFLDNKRKMPTNDVSIRPVSNLVKRTDRPQGVYIDQLITDMEKESQDQKESQVHSAARTVAVMQGAVLAATTVLALYLRNL